MDWLPKPAQWPVVVAGPQEKHVSIREPQVSTPAGLCSRESVARILTVSGPPAVRQILTGLRRLNVAAPRLRGEIPDRPILPEPPVPPVEPRLEDYRAPPPEDTTLTRLSRALFGESGPTPDERRRYDAAQSRFRDDWRRYESAHRAYEQTFARVQTERASHDERCRALEAELAEAEREHAAAASAYRTAIAADSDALERLFDDAVENRPGGVEALAMAVWQAIPLPADFPRTCEAAFDDQTGVLLVTVEAPDFERVSLTTALKTTRSVVGDRGRRAAQQAVNHVLPLRLVHEIFATPELATVTLVGVNVRLAYIDRRTGQPRHDIVASLSATREEFDGIEISQVDAKKCFRSLRGVETPSYDEVAAIKPLLQFDRDDRRIVQGRDVVDGLDASTNLAAMDWDDFEHVVRELFAKMFAARSAGAEVHVTRASRDYGVDALVYDPDPIMGGKYVIQAKRYVNTVEVAAVRDLFGTVQNEGASKGFLVTTSAFGPDAYQFAKGKPLTLIDGPQLLGLLGQYGYDFRIDLREARKLLHGR